MVRARGEGGGVGIGVSDETRAFREWQQKGEWTKCYVCVYVIHCNVVVLALS